MSADRSRVRRTWAIASDLLIATAVLWTLPLLLGVAAAVIGLVLRAIGQE